MKAQGKRTQARGLLHVLAASAIVVAGVAVGPSQGAQVQKTPPCVLSPQLRDVTINQGIGAYTPLVNGKETLVRFYLSMPSCAGSGASIQITSATLTLSNGASGTIQAPTPALSSTAYPILAAFTAAPMADSTGDPKFVVPGSMVSKSAAFTANFATTITWQAKATRSGGYGPVQSSTFSNRPGTSTPISASFDRPSNALGVLFVPMGDATKTYSTQWTAQGQQALQDGMTAAVARQYPLPAGIGNLGGTGGLRYMVAPTLLDLKRLNLLDTTGKFCGTGGNYDLIKAELAQFRLSHNTANPNAQANRVVGIVDPAVGLGPPSPCFEGMAVVNSQEAWALARPGRAGQLIGLELAHTLGLTPPNRESPFDGAHSQNIAAENPSLNRRYNLVQRSFITTDRSLLKPSATSPTPDNINTLLEIPDFAFLLCVFGGTLIPECQTYGPGTVNANAPVAATLSFVMSGSTTGGAGLPAGGTGAAAGTSVVESYFASTVPQTAPLASSEYRLVQRNAAGTILPAPNGNQGVPVLFSHSEHGGAPHVQHSGLFSFVLPFDTNANRIELWKGAPGAAGSLLLYAQDRTAPPQVTNLSVGSGPIILSPPASKAATAAPLATMTVTNTNDSGAGSLRDAINQANTSPGADTINFEIAGSGVHTITPLSQLPHLLQTTTIDGTTEDDYVAGGAPRIEINGASAGGSQGIWIEAPDSTIRGLTINRFLGFGIYIAGTASNTRVEANYVGLDATGTLAAGNGGGIQSLSTGNTIGGSTAAERNVVAGNPGTAIHIVSTTTVRGNYIGTTADGLTARGNLEGITVTGNGNTIGGPNPGEGNVLSGSTTTTGAGAGVSFSSSAASNTVEGNLIGTNKDGTAAIPNSRRGIYVGADGGANNVIRDNLISGNNGSGVVLAGPGVRVEGNLIGTASGGTIALANIGSGIEAGALASNSIIGGTTSVAGNVISGNGSAGVRLNTASNVVQGNWIGTTEAGASLPNSFDGIEIGAGGTGNTIGGEGSGEPNRIRSNGRDGVRITGGTGNRVSANEISGNGGLGIDLSGNGVSGNDAGDGDTGPNNLQNFPVLTSATGGASTSVTGSLDSAAGTYRVEFFANSACDGTNGEGARFLGATNTSPGSFSATGLGATSAGEVVTATATDSAGNTSEFSVCEPVVVVTGDAPQSGPTFTVNTSTDGSPTTSGCTTSECTLREAITAANAASGANTIEFDIGGDTQIALQDGLPGITSPVLIDGLSQPEGTIVINGDGAGAESNGLQLGNGSSGSEIRGLEIRDFSSTAGIAIFSSSNTMSSNTIHSVSEGIVVSGSGATGNVIGDNVGPGGLSEIDDALGNVLVQVDGSGVFIGSGASGTVVAGNYLGTDRSGATTRGNVGRGIHVEGGASNNQLGPGNRVAYNSGAGIGIRSGAGNRIVANSIHHNLGDGIAIDEGANSDLPEPILASATSSGGTTTVSGTFRGGLGVSDGPYFVEFFKNSACDTPGGSGEGETFLNFVTVTGSATTGGSFTASVSGLSIGDVVTATLTRGHAPPDTSEFSNCETVEQAQDVPPGQEPWSASASDADNPEDATLDGYLDCGDGVLQTIFVGKKPDSVQGNSAHWSGTIDTSLAEDGCVLKVAATDQFTRPPITTTGTETVNDGPNTVIAAISSPREGATILQYGLIPLRGLILDAQGVLPVGDHRWDVDGPGTFARSGTNPIVDLQPPSGGWPSGAYTATLTKPGSTHPSATDTVTFTVLVDADNDGIPKSVEDSCLGGGDDDPTNADDDRDADGIPNVNDPQPCVAATSFTAIVDINPDPLPVPSNGNPVTASVRVPGKNIAQVLASSVRITRIADQDVSTNNDFRNVGWTISNGVGTAKFDRQKLIQHLAQRNIHNRLVTITVGGRSGAPPWNFEGSDTIFVQG